MTNENTKNKLSPTQRMCRERILEKQRHIYYLNSEINQLAKDFIPDFHFLDYSVSTFWTCDKSPIGMCVFNIEDIKGSFRRTECRYCGDPDERK